MVKKDGDCLSIKKRVTINSKIDNMWLDTRFRNRLKDVGVKRLGDIFWVRAMDLMQTKNAGQDTLVRFLRLMVRFRGSNAAYTQYKFGDSVRNKASLKDTRVEWQRLK